MSCVECKEIIDINNASDCCYCFVLVCKSCHQKLLGMNTPMNEARYICRECTDDLERCKKSIEERKKRVEYEGQCLQLNNLPIKETNELLNMLNILKEKN